jgi:hypothetical protein
MSLDGKRVSDPLKPRCEASAEAAWDWGGDSIVVKWSVRGSGQLHVIPSAGYSVTYMEHEKQ